jgi:hypothetical protein
VKTSNLTKTVPAQIKTYLELNLRLDTLLQGAENFATSAIKNRVTFRTAG